jgi:hypothetical protein
MEMTTINWDIIPKYTIDCSKLTTAAEISAIFESCNVDKYLYRIKYKGILIKYGMSADKSKTWGDRIYRQIGHLASWGAARLTGSSGADFRVTETDFFNLYGIELDHKHIELRIFDVTKYPFDSIKPRNQILEMESSLIQDYEKLTGSKPIGNLNDEANYYGKPYTKRELVDSLFDGFPALV